VRAADEADVDVAVILDRQAGDGAAERDDLHRQVGELERRLNRAAGRDDGLATASGLMVGASMVSRAAIICRAITSRAIMSCSLWLYTEPW